MNAIMIKDLTYHYPSGRHALKGVSLELPEGTRTALIGKNGSGKSTLLLHINGLLDGGGIIEVSGVRRSRATIAEIRKKIGLLFGQTEYHFIMTDLLRDVMLGVRDAGLSPEQKRGEAMGWLRYFGLEGYASASPMDLSSGEMKRAALAGVLAAKPEILLLDEPLNGLDRESAAGLVSLLKEVPATMIIATHRLFLVETLATHVAVMDEGIITGFYPVEKGLRLKKVKDLLY